MNNIYLLHHLLLMISKNYKHFSLLKMVIILLLYLMHLFLTIYFFNKNLDSLLTFYQSTISITLILLTILFHVHVLKVPIYLILLLLQVIKLHNLLHYDVLHFLHYLFILLLLTRYYYYYYYLFILHYSHSNLLLYHFLIQYPFFLLSFIIIFQPF